MTKNKNDLFYKNEFVWEKIDDKAKKEVFAVGEDYKAFLDAGKTDRESFKEIVKRAETEVFVPLSSVKNLSAVTKF